MLNTAIIYESKHHGNTKKLVDAIAQAHDVTLIDALTDSARDLSGYDLIGFASGIYCAKSGKNVLKYAENHLPGGQAGVSPLYLRQSPRRLYRCHRGDCAEKGFAGDRGIRLSRLRYLRPV